MHKKSSKKLLGIGLIVIFAVLAAGAMVAISHTPAKVIAPSRSAAPAATKPRVTPVMITLPGAQPIKARAADYAIDSDQWVLVNKTHPLSHTDYAPAPVAQPNVPERTDKTAAELSVRSDIIPAVEKLFAGAKAAGYDLVLASGYRSAALQKQYFDSYAASDGVEAANRYSAHPGQSEHQTGLAFDITTQSRVCYLVECFGDTPEAKWVAVHAHEYGFIIRYPKDKEATTGYQYEPWHLRYLGTELAGAVYVSGLTYEDAWPYLVKANDELRSRGQI